MSRRNSIAITNEQTRIEITAYTKKLIRTAISNTLKSEDFKGIQLTQIDSCLLNKKDISRVLKQMDKVKSIPDMDCRRPGNPWILEYNDGTEYKCFAISNYCLRGQKELRPVASLCYFILGLGNKYFETHY